MTDDGADIVQMADLKQDNSLISPVECLRDVVRRIEAGEISPDKLIIVTLQTERDGEDGYYETHYFASNMRLSEQIALLATKTAHMTRVLLRGD